MQFTGSDLFCEKEPEEVLYFSIIMWRGAPTAFLVHEFFVRVGTIKLCIFTHPAIQKFTINSVYFIASKGMLVKLVKVDPNRNIRIRLGAIKNWRTMMSTMEYNRNRKNSGISLTIY
jgi:hypothetical protein